MKLRFYRAVTLPLVGLSLCWAGPSFSVEDDELEEVRLLATPTSDLSIGVGLSSNGNSAVNRDHSNRESDYRLELNLHYNQRDDETGTWTRATVQQQSLDTRMARFEQLRQGNWHYFIEFDERETRPPLTIDTSLEHESGLQISAADTVLTESDLGLVRRNAAIGARQQLTPQTAIQLGYRLRSQDGRRPWARAVLSRQGAVSLYQESPIDWRTHEAELAFSHTEQALQVAGGYRLSLFENPSDKVKLDPSNIDTTLDTQDTSTPPDNRSHAIYLNGGYQLSKQTRATLHLSHSRDRQDETLETASTTVGNDRSFEGRIDRTRIDLGLSTRSSRAVTLTGRLYYHDVDDRTDINTYLAGGQTNRTYDQRQSGGSVDMRVRLQPTLTMLTGAAIDRNSLERPEGHDMAWRGHNSETTLYAGIQQRFDAATLALKVIHANRDGGKWFSGRGVAEGTRLTTPDSYNYVGSTQFADRVRNTLRLTANWQLSETIDTQLSLQTQQATYSGLDLGVDSIRSNRAALDFNWLISDEWQFGSWLAYDRSKRKGSSHGWQDQLTRDYAQSYQDSEQTWGYQDTDHDLTFGLRVRGALSDEIRLGGDLSLSKATADLTLSSESAPAEDSYAPGSLPEDHYREARLSLFSEFLFDENKGLRLDYRYTQLKMDQWAWALSTDYADAQATLPEKTSDQVVLVTWFYRGW